MGVNEENIEDVLEVKVHNDDPDDDLDKSIAKVTLDGISDKKLSLTVTFNDLSAITKDISEPDLLEIKFLRPGLFIDAETRLPLD